MHFFDWLFHTILDTLFSKEGFLCLPIKYTEQKKMLVNGLWSKFAGRDGVNVLSQTFTLCRGWRFGDNVGSNLRLNSSLPFLLHRSIAIANYMVFIETSYLQEEGRIMGEE